MNRIVVKVFFEFLISFFSVCIFINYVKYMQTESIQKILWLNSTTEKINVISRKVDVMR